MDPGREIRGKESGDEAEASTVQGEEGMAWIAAVSLILRHQAAWTGRTYLPLLHPRDLSNHPGVVYCGSHPTPTGFAPSPLHSMTRLDLSLAKPFGTPFCWPLRTTSAPIPPVPRAQEGLVGNPSFHPEDEKIFFPTVRLKKKTAQTTDKLLASHALGFGAADPPFPIEFVLCEDDRHI